METKFCKQHGQLQAEQFFFSGRVRQVKCKACRKITAKNNYENNKEKIQKRHKEYQQTNPEKVKEMKRKSYLKRKAEIEEKFQIQIKEKYVSKYHDKIIFKLKSLILIISRLQREADKLKGIKGISV